MTRVNELASFIEQRIADAEADLGPEAIGWVGMDAMNRARGRVSALREVQDRLTEMGVADVVWRDPITGMRWSEATSVSSQDAGWSPQRADMWNETWIGKENLAEEKWQNLRDSGYDETDLRRAGGDR